MQEQNKNIKKAGRLDVIKGLGWLLLPIIIGYIIYLLNK